MQLPGPHEAKRICLSKLLVVYWETDGGLHAAVPISETRGLLLEASALILAMSPLWSSGKAKAEKQQPHPDPMQTESSLSAGAEGRDRADPVCQGRARQAEGRGVGSSAVRRDQEQAAKAADKAAQERSPHLEG